MKHLLAGITITVAVLILSQFMYVLPLHIGAFFVTITFVIIADICGLIWLLGKVETLPEKALTFLHNAVSVGLFVMIATGAVMAWPLQEYLLSKPAFLIKMLFVVVLIINAFFIHSHTTIASISSFAALPSADKRKLLISGAVSGVSWVGAFIAAQFIGL